MGGSRAGSGLYVYQLGRKATDFYQGRYAPARAVNYHSLAIADCYLELRRLEAAGSVEIIGLSTEPDCHVSVGGRDLKPDMYVEIGRRERSKLYLWLEIDMGTESQARLREKMQRYYRAYDGIPEGDGLQFPGVVFVAVDEDRRRELAWLLTQIPKQARHLFKVVAKEHLSELF